MVSPPCDSRFLALLAELELRRRGRPRRPPEEADLPSPEEALGEDLAVDLDLFRAEDRGLRRRRRDFFCSSLIFFSVRQRQHHQALLPARDTGDQCFSAFLWRCSPRLVH